MLRFGNGQVHSFEWVKIHRPSFVKMVLAEPRVGSLHEFQQYLINKGHTITNDRVIKFKVAAVCKKTKEQRQTVLCDVFTDGKYKGQSFEAVFKKDLPYFMWYSKEKRESNYFIRQWMQKEKLI